MAGVLTHVSLLNAGMSLRHSAQKNKRRPTNRRALLVISCGGGAGSGQGDESDEGGAGGGDGEADGGGARGAGSGGDGGDGAGERDGGGGPARRLCRCALVLVGNLNESSLRLSNELEEGHEVARGQRLACFAGGGSGAALLLFDAAVELAEACAEAHAQGLPFRLDAGAGLAVPCANAAGAEESRARG